MWSRSSLGPPSPVRDPRARLVGGDKGGQQRGEQVVETRTFGFISRSFPSRTDRKTRHIQPRAESPSGGHPRRGPGADKVNRRVHGGGAVWRRALWAETGHRMSPHVTAAQVRPGGRIPGTTWRTHPPLGVSAPESRCNPANSPGAPGLHYMTSLKPRGSTQAGALSAGCFHPEMPKQRPEEPPNAAR